MIRIIRTPKKFQGTSKEMKIAQGYNQIDKLFFIYITDRKSKITCRINMDEEFYQNFHNMGSFTYRQTKKDEGEFIDEINVNRCEMVSSEFREPTGRLLTLDPDDEMKENV